MKRVFPVRLVRLLSDVTGIHHDPDRHYLLDSRLSGLLKSFSLDSLEELGLLLERTPPDQEPWLAVYDAISTGETYFFRDHAGLDLIFPSLIGSHPARSGPVRLLSVGCSSGEEVYTLAILALVAGRLPSVLLEGIDLSSGQIAKAREGVFAQRSVRLVPPGLLERAFIREGHFFRIKDELREVVRFSRENILSFSKPANSYDGILFRNVIIYFEDSVRKKMIEIFYKLIAPGGFLLMGSGEFLPDGGSPFLLESHNGIVVYRKK